MNCNLAWLGFISGVLATGTIAPPAFAGTLVGTELVLSVDISASVDEGEFNLQRQGYVNAFRDTELIDLIEGLDNGIAVTMQYWSNDPLTPLDWFHITDAASANAFADAIADTSRPEGNLTNIAAAIYSATDLLLTNEFDGDRRVIDISGDGTQNINLNTSQLSFCSTFFKSQNNRDPACTGWVSAARDAAIAQGITINGLPILTDVADLDGYFLDYVIGGEGAFVQATANFSDFETAVKAKIKREIVPNLDPTTVPEPSAILGLSLLALVGVRSLLEGKRQ